MTRRIRRVVSGLDASGRSSVIFDGDAPSHFEVPGVPGQAVSFLWKTDDAPASNEGSTDAVDVPMQFPPNPRGTCFFVFEYPPLSAFDHATPAERLRALQGGHSDDEANDATKKHPGMHRTDTLDYVVVISGEITVVLETGEVTLGAGDVFVDRGVYHAWENRGKVPAVFASIVIDATSPSGQRAG